MGCCRNQKVVEEAPSLLLTPETRAKMQSQAAQLAKAAGAPPASPLLLLLLPRFLLLPLLLPAALLPLLLPASLLLLLLPLLPSCFPPLSAALCCSPLPPPAPAALLCFLPLSSPSCRTRLALSPTVRMHSRR